MADSIALPVKFQQAWRKTQTIKRPNRSSWNAAASPFATGSSGGWATVGRRGRRPRDEADVPVPAEAGPKAAEPEAGCVMFGVSS